MVKVNQVILDSNSHFEIKRQHEDKIIAVFGGNDTASGVKQVVFKERRLFTPGARKEYSTRIQAEYKMFNSFQTVSKEFSIYSNSDNFYCKMPEETQKLILKTLAAMNYEDAKTIKSYDEVQYNPSDGEFCDVIDSVHRILSKDFQHKNIQYLLAYHSYATNFSYPDWFIQSIYEQEDELNTTYRDVDEYVKNSSYFQNGATKSLIAFSYHAIISQLFMENNYELTAIRGFNQRSHTTQLNFSFTTLILQWFFNQDLSYSFNDSIKDGLSFKKTVKNVSDYIILESVCSLSETLIKSSLKNGFVQKSELNNINEQEVYELLGKLRETDQWKKLFSTTVYEVLTDHHGVFSIEGINKRHKTSYIVESIILFWTYGRKNRNYDPSKLRQALSTYKHEIPVKVDEFFYGLTEEMRESFVAWTDYCESNTYIPFSMFFNLDSNDDSE